MRIRLRDGYESVESTNQGRSEDKVRRKYKIKKRREEE